MSAKRLYIHFLKGVTLLSWQHTSSFLLAWRAYVRVRLCVCVCEVMGNFHLSHL